MPGAICNFVKLYQKLNLKLARQSAKRSLENNLEIKFLITLKII
jgi:hypothetical protein